MNATTPIEKKELVSWALYDCGNSAFFSIIQSFIFSSYFTSSVAENPILGSTQWGNAIGFTGILLAFFAPILGGIADEGGNRKGWTFLFTLICTISTSLLWFIKPDSTYISLALFLIIIATFSSEVSFVFYNSMLPSLTKPHNIGLWSGCAWGLGYIGGLICLLICLGLFIYPAKNPLGLDASASEQIRATFVFTALWYFLFSLPLFLITQETAPKGKPFLESVKNGFFLIISNLKNIKKFKHIVIFLIANMIYLDALATLFAFTGIFAAGIYHMSPSQIVLLGVILNLGSGFGSFVFAYIDDKIGSKNVIFICLISLILSTFSLYFIEEQRFFWIAAITISLFIGPLQSSSRTFIARVSPPEQISQFFGLFVLSGKATSFIGPFLVAFIIHVTQSQRPSILVLPFLFLIGFGIICHVKEQVGNR